ncbi:MAG TPA: flagellar biosynthesis anti-sigma factor FlgM [Colwellia sp.]|nr:flagellar biosynthesis anti-sigma factor FlgM [Colwellia sp.]
MTININNLNKQAQIQQNKQTQVNQQTAQSASTQVKQVNQDSVSLTPQAKQISEFQKKANDAPIVDQKKVDELKKAITAGEYKVDPQKLAASIASFEFDIV